MDSDEKIRKAGKIIGIIIGIMITVIVFIILLLYIDNEYSTIFVLIVSFVSGGIVYGSVYHITKQILRIRKTLHINDTENKHE